MARKNALRMIAVVVVVAAVAAIALSRNNSALWPWSGELDYDEAADRLERVIRDIDITQAYVTHRANVALGRRADIKDSLPAIEEFPLVVDPPIATGDVSVEIFVSTEKSGKGSDGWLNEVANAFNQRSHRLNSGRVAKVRIRKIASGIGYLFIASGKYRPQAFSPSNHLWVRMASAHGAEMVPVSERLVGNVAGIVMKSDVASRMRESYGSLDVRNLINAVVQGNLVMGYTNPFASSTGLNFLVTVLATFANGVGEEMLSPEVISAFEGFQHGVPFVALTTLQMRDSVEQDGSLDAFVMEYQTFIKTASLNSGYEFIPFGVRHDNPLYALGPVSPDVSEALELFAAFATESRYRDLAREYGFDTGPEHDPAVEMPSGDRLVRAQQIWKEKKDAGRAIAAVFVCDVSGSMGGTRLRGVKEALALGSEFITPGNAIGLVLFSNRVRVVLPVKRFDLNHKAAFLAAVQDMSANGGTAMYDGVFTGLSMLVEAQRKDPSIKPMLFVLTDGKTNEGFTFEKSWRVIKGLNIPVYTIGYEADFEELGRLSSIVEAASINANEGQIKYKIGSLLNAQM